jgi:predicted transport protein
VINQGLFYLDWLLDHKAEFEMQVLDLFGTEAKDNIEWSTPRLVCIAGDFTRYDEHAVQQINRNIELIRYKKFGDELLILEQVNTVSASGTVEVKPSTAGGKKEYPTPTYRISKASPELQDRYEALRSWILALGDDVQEKVLKHYIAFRRIKNFATVDVHPVSGNILVWLKLDPASIELEEGFSRDVTNIGHHSTGHLELNISNDADFERAKHLIEKSYDVS